MLCFSGVTLPRTRDQKVIVWKMMKKMVTRCLFKDISLRPLVNRLDWSLWQSSKIDFVFALISVTVHLNIQAPSPGGTLYQITSHLFVSTFLNLVSIPLLEFSFFWWKVERKQTALDLVDNRESFSAQPLHQFMEQRTWMAMRTL